MFPKRIFISGPSGSGKSTVINYLLTKFPEELRLSISHTTRKKRENESDHKDYHFISKEDFILKIQNNEMYEYQLFNNEYYGTSFDELNLSNKSVIFDLGRIGIEVARKNNLEGIYISILCNKHKLKENIEKRIGMNNLKNDQILDIKRRLEEYEKDEEFFKSSSFDYVLKNKKALKVC